MKKALTIGEVSTILSNLYACLEVDGKLQVHLGQDPPFAGQLGVSRIDFVDGRIIMHIDPCKNQDAVTFKEENSETYGYPRVEIHSCSCACGGDKAWFIVPCPNVQVSWGCICHNDSPTLDEIMGVVAQHAS